MNRILNLGRWLFPLSFLMYVMLHFGKADTGADFVPDFLPFPYFWNYFTGLCVLAFIISALIQKFDKLATVLMALYVFLMIFLVHLPRAAESELEMINAFRNVMVVGALLVYARYVAKDNRVVG
ncbi:MAG: hypothetical protein H6573_02940 [Lewinellaceae bacterium]|nr:hypothetical protein [Phaeodactylibacter sp.]MCB9346449.1 hypothetical protein [Lewinellaceae bacterium]